MKQAKSRESLFASQSLYMLLIERDVIADANMSLQNAVTQRLRTELDRVNREAAEELRNAKPTPHEDIARMQREQQMRQTHPGYEFWYTQKEGVFGQKPDDARFGTALRDICRAGQIAEDTAMLVMLCALAARGLINADHVMTYLFEFITCNANHDYNVFNAMVLQDHQVLQDKAISEGAQVAIFRAPPIDSLGLGHLRQWLDQQA